MKRGLARDVRVRIHRRVVLRIPRGSRVLVREGEQYLALVLHANGALHASRPPRGWSFEAGRRIAGEREATCDELWLTIGAPRRARVEFELLPSRRRGSA